MQLQLSQNFLLCPTSPRPPPLPQQEILKVMKSKDLQPRLLYPAKLSLRMEGQINSFPDKKKLTGFIITKPVLYEMLTGLI